MNPKQLSKLAMYLAVKDICDNNNTIWQPLKGFAAAYADLKTCIVNIQTLSQNQAESVPDIAQQAARLNMCSLTLPIADAIHLYALKTKNNQIAAQTSLSMSALMGGEASESATRCQNIHNLANANLAVLGNYGVTVAKLTLLTGAINAYNLSVNASRSDRTAGKIVADNLQTEFDAADKDLAVMDKLVGQFSANRKFGNDYHNARKIVDPSASHTSPNQPVPQIKTQPMARPQAGA